MVNEYSYWQQIRDTHVIDETCHIAIVPCIDAVCLSILNTENRPNLYQHTYAYRSSPSKQGEMKDVLRVHIFSNPFFAILPSSLDFIAV